MSATVATTLSGIADNSSRESIGLCVLNVAFPFARVGPDAVGGAEQIVFQVDHAITSRGGHSLVIACEGSSVSGNLIPVSSVEGIITPKQQQRIWGECLSQIEYAIRRYRVDLIHFHGIDFRRYLPKCDVPKIATLHLPPTWYPAEIFSTEHPSLFVHGVSHSQHRCCPPCEALLPWIENGVPVPSKMSRQRKSNYILALGRICPEKGFHLALDAARLAAKPMVLAGAVFGYETHYHYFQTEIVPRLDDQRKFIGPVGKEKGQLLAQARCLVIPSLVPETSSLVAMEALAAGTPVIAFRQGALPEIVEHGSTGFLVDNVREMADAIHAVDALPPEQCWRSAHKRFRLERMVGQYLERYRWLVEHVKNATNVTSA